MEMLEMGANMQCNSHFPGCYSTRNHRMDTNGSTWPLICDDKTMKSEYYYSGFMLPLSPSQLLGYNKEILKQTMLKQETIFKDQIQELHRLYGRQKELMDEIRRDELHKHDLRFEVACSKIALSQSSSQKSIQAPSLPLVNLSHAQMSVSGLGHTQSPLSVVQGKNIQACPYPARSEGCSKDVQVLESKCKKVGKKILDLQLSADEYIDIEEYDLLDNEKIAEVPEVTSYPLRRLPQDVCNSDGKPVLEGNGLNCVFYGDAPSFHQSNHKSCAGRTLYGLENSKTNFGSHNDRHSGHSGAFYACNSNEHVLETEMTCRSSSLVTMRKLRDFERHPIAVQALPCFNTSVPLSKKIKSSAERPELDGNMLYNQKNSECSLKSDSEIYLNGSFSNVSQMDSKVSKANPKSLDFVTHVRNDDSDSVSDNHGRTKLQKDSVKVKTSSDINLNIMPPSCSSDVSVSQSIQKTHGVQRHEDPMRGFPWLRAKPAFNGEAGKGCEDQTLVESVTVQAYSACINDLEQKKGEASDLSCKGKPSVFCDHSSSSGFPCKTIQKPFEDVKSKEKDAVLDLNMAFDSFSESEIELGADEHATENKLNGKYLCFTDHIDLNSSINDNEFSSCRMTEIDLEAPVSPENKECSPPRGESDENQLETPFISSGQEDGDLQDELARVAAESIISISSCGLKSCLGKSPSKQFESSNNSLDWFAGIVSLLVGDPEDELAVALDSKEDIHNEKLLPEEMDYFEAMTLKLTETKVEEYCFRSNMPKEEETATSSPLSQPRKGRTRRARQRKDFQKEILPSLASLSRYEVTEDLQTIGGLMEAAGTRWETGPLRYGVRNGYMRGRKRSCVSTSSGIDSTAGSLQKQLSSNPKPGNEERSIICWGKVTRRRRGQRYRVCNPKPVQSRV
ncbi:hypothetical protein FEM48_Zijuj05G0137500 [Ziziphus jujuba var. spinosa]|uniref:Uncharacterized protein n=1 Tax=Ziziphus jujuba var. spinosa TaxID=714518 RepID=A0A978VF64_ZIZJJ|nr:hypothetical protein FEM48_Zijuj05G0137500 [Ziziphus jujuba var. spinosa]